MPDSVLWGKHWDIGQFELNIGRSVCGTDEVPIRTDIHECDP